MASKGLAPVSLAVTIAVRTSASAAHMFGFGRTHGAVAVRDFSLDHAGTEFAFRRVVGDVDLAGIIADREKLVSRPTNFCL